MIKISVKDKDGDITPTPSLISWIYKNPSMHLTNFINPNELEDGNHEFTDDNFASYTNITIKRGKIYQLYHTTQSGNKLEYKEGEIVLDNLNERRPSSLFCGLVLSQIIGFYLGHDLKIEIETDDNWQGAKIDLPQLIKFVTSMNDNV